MGNKRSMVMLFGKMGCGKSYLARDMKRYFDRNPDIGMQVEIVNVSKILLEEFDILTDIFYRGISERRLMLDVGLVGRTEIPHLINVYYESLDKGIDKTASLIKRKILQKYGTEVAGLISKEKIFVEKLMSDLIEDLKKNDRNALFVNDGCRFPFEIEVAIRYGFKPIPVVMNVSDCNTMETFSNRYIEDAEYDSRRIDSRKASIASLFGDPTFSSMFHYSELAHTVLEGKKNVISIYGRHDSQFSLKCRIEDILTSMEKIHYGIEDGYL